MTKILIKIFSILLLVIKNLSINKQDLILENLALRQQLANYKQKIIKSEINDNDRVFWIALKQIWGNWADSLIIVKPETVIHWQKQRFKSYWTKKCQQGKTLGRPAISIEIKRLIKRMARENPLWGAPTIHGELLKLGFDVCQNTISKYIPQKPQDPRKVQSWKTFLKNHRDVTCAMDFFVVPTVNFTLLYVFFIIDHATRKIVHWNVTEHPTSFWVRLQLKEAFPWDTAPKYLVFDRDPIFNGKVKTTIKNIGIKPKVIGRGKPWQNGTAERWVRTVKQGILHHVIIFNEGHLHRLMLEYVDYYTHRA